MNSDQIEALSEKLAVPVVRPKVDRGVPVTHGSSVKLLKGILRDPSPISPDSNAVTKIARQNMHRLSMAEDHNSTVQNMNYKGGRFAQLVEDEGRRM